MKTTLNCQTTRVKDLILDYRNSQWNNLLGLLRHQEDISSLYKLNKFLLRKPQPHRSLKDCSGNLILEANLKTFSGYNGISIVYTNHSQPHWNHSPRPSRHAFRYSLYFSNILLSRTCLRNIKELFSRRAPVTDELSTSMLKHCSHKTISHLCHIFNCWTRLEYLPPC